MGMRAANLLPLGPNQVGVSNPRRLNPDVKKIIFGQVARFDPIKRLDFFANTVNALGARGVLVCPSSNSLEQKRFAERALEMGVQVYSHGDPSQVWDGCDVYFSSSSYESLGLSMLEALSSGIPVLTTAAGGPREIFSGMLCAGIVSQNPTTDEILIALNKISDNWTQYWIDANNLLESRSIQKCTDMILEQFNG
jgi:glycosyltransferase involved in cell wall biosynthesis